MRVDVFKVGEVKFDGLPNSRPFGASCSPFGASCSPFGELRTDFDLHMLGIPPTRETADAHQVVGCDAQQRLAGEFLATDQLGLKLGYLSPTNYERQMAEKQPITVSANT